jgi:glycosyltransferase involved in cell wall biosynthesis
VGLRIIVTGLIAQHPRLGGITWHYLHYLLGLKKLGHDVSYVEDSGQWPYHIDSSVANDPTAYDCTPNVSYLTSVMARFGIADKWAYRFPISGQWFGMASESVKELVRTADLLVNVSGTLEHPEEYHGRARLVYIDTDPVFTQIQLALGENAEFAARIAAHHVHFTFAQHMEALPPTPYRWVATRQPIELSEWPESQPIRETFTTIMNWVSYPPLWYRGECYGQKDVEFLRFVDLPSRVSTPLEVAVPVIRQEHWKPTDVLASSGWQRVNAFDACGDLDKYRAYISSSRAEWTVAKNLYVRGQTGWFSERSACYLATGKPVVTQDTGLAGVIPTGEGLVAFRTLDEAVAAIEDINRDYSRHARTAREIARQYFDASTVLAELLDRAGTS